MKYFIFFILCVLIACDDILVNEELQLSKTYNFEICWKEFDRYYTFFDYKNIDWDSVYNVYQPLVNDNLTDNEFLDLLSSMCLTLTDRHVNIFTPFRDFNSYKFLQTNQPYNFISDNVIKEKYLENIIEFNNVIFCGDTKDNNFGYIRVRNFWYQNTPKFEAVHTILADFSGKDGI